MNTTAPRAPSLATHLVAGGYASIFLSLFGGLWMILALNSESWIWIVACVLIPATLLLMRGIGMVLSGHEASAGMGDGVEERLVRQQVGRRLGWLILGDFAAFMIAANALGRLGLSGWIVAAIAAIAGLQFFPWARIFDDTLYLITGGVELALCAALAVLFRHNITLADSLFGLVMGLTLWITVVFLLLRGRRALALLSQAAAR